MSTSRSAIAAARGFAKGPRRGSAARLLNATSAAGIAESKGGRPRFHKSNPTHPAAANATNAVPGGSRRVRSSRWKTNDATSATTTTGSISSRVPTAKAPQASAKLGRPCAATKSASPAKATAGATKNPVADQAWSGMQHPTKAAATEPPRRPAPGTDGAAANPSPAAHSIATGNPIRFNRSQTVAPGSPSRPNACAIANATGIVAKGPSSPGSTDIPDAAVRYRPSCPPGKYPAGGSRIRLARKAAAASTRGQRRSVRGNATRRVGHDRRAIARTSRISGSGLPCSRG